MKEKWYIINRYIIAMLFICISASMYGLETDIDSTLIKRQERLRKRWEQLIPTHSKLQYAGNMGMLSLGIGWDYGSNNHWETDIMFGYIPKHQSGRSKITFTLKQNFMPWSMKLGNSPFLLEPLSCGLYANNVFGDEFWNSEPDRYPKGYYGFSSKIRFHIYWGQRITFYTGNRKSALARKITFFYELSVSDLYLVSAFTNSYLKPKDYLSLSFGLKLQVL